MRSSRVSLISGFSSVSWSRSSRRVFQGVPQDRVLQRFVELTSTKIFKTLSQDRVQQLAGGVISVVEVFTALSWDRVQHLKVEVFKALSLDRVQQLVVEQIRRRSSKLLLRTEFNNSLWR